MSALEGLKEHLDRCPKCGDCDTIEIHVAKVEIEKNRITPRANNWCPTCEPHYHLDVVRDFSKDALSQRTGKLVKMMVVKLEIVVPQEVASDAQQMFQDMALSEDWAKRVALLRQKAAAL